MHYGGEQSGGKTPRVASALRDKFSFGSARTSSQLLLWSGKRDEVIENIQNEMPVQAGISYFLLWHGHSVVLDGYQSPGGYFHVNMGGHDPLINTWYDLPVIETPYGDYNVIRSLVYDILPYQGWNQYGADAQNTFSSVYGAPQEITQKWRDTCLSDFSFSDILIGTSNHVYAAASKTCFPVPCSGHPFVYVIDQFGTILRQIELNRDCDIRFMCQSQDGEIFAAMDSGYIYRVDPKQGSAIQIFTEPYGDDIDALKIDEEGWLFAATSHHVYALTRTGAPRWATPFAAPSGTMFLGSRSIPAIDVSSRQRIYITYYNTTTKHAYLAALNRLNGQAAQTRDFGALTMAAPRVPSLGDDGTVYIGMPGVLYALNPDDFLGTPRWIKSLLIDNETPAVGRDGTLYFSYWEQNGGIWYDKLGAFDPSNGAMRWSVPFQLDENEESIFQPYIAGNGIVLFTIEHNGTPKTYTLHAYKDNGSSAESLWVYPAGVSGGDYAFGPGRTVYAWGKTGLARTIYALSDGDVGDPDGAGMDFENNSAPMLASNPSPADGAVSQDTVSVQLSWTCSDPDGHALKYDIYACALLDSEEAAFVPVASQVTGNSYTLEHLQKGTQYLWSVVATDGQAISEGPVWSFSTLVGSGVEDDEGIAILPKEFELGQNYPNPFNPNSSIEFSLPKDCFVRISIYNILGQKVRTLVDEYLQAGYKRVIWDSKNDQGEEVASGVYFYGIEAEDYTQTRKMVLLK